MRNSRFTPPDKPYVPSFHKPPVEDFARELREVWEKAQAGWTNATDWRGRQLLQACRADRATIPEAEQGELVELLVAFAGPRVPEDVRVEAFRVMEGWRVPPMTAALPFLLERARDFQDGMGQHWAVTTLEHFKKEADAAAPAVQDVYLQLWPWREEEQNRTVIANSRGSLLALLLHASAETQSRFLKEARALGRDFYEVEAVVLQDLSFAYSDSYFRRAIKKAVLADRASLPIVLSHLDSAEASSFFADVVASSLRKKGKGWVEHLIAGLQTLMARGDVKLPDETLALLCSNSEQNLRLAAIGSVGTLKRMETSEAPTAIPEGRGKSSLSR